MLDPTPFLVDTSLNAFDAQAIIGRRQGYETAVVAARFEMINLDLVVPGSTNITVGDITPYTTQGVSITHDRSQAVHGAMTLPYAENTAVDFNTLHHTIRPWLGYYDRDPNHGGHLLLEIPLGIYTTLLPDRTLPGQLSRSNPALTGNQWALSMTDLTALLSIEFLETYAIVAGSDPIAALVTLIEQDSIPVGLGGTGRTPAGGMFAGPAWPLGHLADPCSIRLAADMVGNPGDNVLAFMQSVTQACGYYDPWVDITGTLRLTVRPDTRGINPGFDAIYSTDAGSVIEPGSVKQSLTTNISSVFNIVRVVSNAGDTPIVSTAANTSDHSAFSLTNYKRGRPHFIQDDTIPDQATCDLRAYLALQSAAALTEPVTWDMALNPLLEDHDYIGLNIVDSLGNVSMAPGMYPLEVTSYTHDLVGKKTSVAAGKLVAL
jgi:hypothetical protein